MKFRTAMNSLHYRHLLVIILYTECTASEFLHVDVSIIIMTNLPLYLHMCHLIEDLQFIRLKLGEKKKIFFRFVLTWTLAHFRSMDAGFSKSYRNGSHQPPSSHQPGTLPSDLPGSINSRRRVIPAGYPRRAAHSPTKEERRLQTSCSLPETPIFGRGWVLWRILRALNVLN